MPPSTVKAIGDGGVTVPHLVARLELQEEAPLRQQQWSVTEDAPSLLLSCKSSSHPSFAGGVSPGSRTRKRLGRRQRVACAWGGRIRSRWGGTPWEYRELQWLWNRLPLPLPSHSGSRGGSNQPHRPLGSCPAVSSLPALGPSIHMSALSNRRWKTSVSMP